jgi:hypothetical protein
VNSANEPESDSGSGESWLAFGRLRLEPRRGN